MKDFFKNVAATIVGLFAFGLIMTILGFICIIGMVASSNSKPALKDNAVMVMKLQGQIEDRTEDNWLGELTGEQFNNITKKKNEKDNDFFSSDADSNYSISSIYRSQVRIEEQ